MTSLDKQFEELITKLNKAEARIIELESDEWINRVKATGICEAFEAVHGGWVPVEIGDYIKDLIEGGNNE